MELQALDLNFTVCKIQSVDSVDFSRDFTFLCKTDDEISLVCETGSVPENTTARENGWKALRISGALDFGLVGVISNIAKTLADAKISIFVVSTFNTDYIFLKSSCFKESIQLLTGKGYTVNR